MRFIMSICAAMLIATVSLFAQETSADTSTSPATEVAPAPESAPVTEAVPAPAAEPAPVVAPAPAAAPEKEGIKATFYGMAMYRFRWIAYANFRKDQGIESANDYQNKLAYKAGVKVKVNNEVSGQFEAGNDWYGTESVDAITHGNFISSVSTGAHRNYNPYFSLAYMKWNPGCFFIDVGIIPVPGSSMLDLIGSGFIAADINAGTAYQKAAHTSWGIITNFSLPGIRLGVPVLKEEFKLGVEVVTSVLEERSVVARIPDSLLNNNSGIMLMADFPMSTGSLTVKPSFIINFNRFYRDSGNAIIAKDEADYEYGFGVETGYKLSGAACVRLGLGYARMSNKNTRLPRVDRPFDEEGVDGNIGTTLTLGPGKLNFDFTLSTDENNKSGTGDYRVYYPFVDVKYGWEVNRNFTILPRMRLFFTRAAENDSRYITKFTTWPELIIYGSF